MRKRLILLCLVILLGLNACIRYTTLGGNQKMFSLSKASPIPGRYQNEGQVSVALAAPQTLPDASATVAVAGPLASPTPLSCWTKPGRTELGSLRTNLLPLPLEYRIHLPPCYDEQPERSYPTLYLIHGMNYYHDQWDRLGASDQADQLVERGELSPFIIVMPRDRNWNEPSEDHFGEALVKELIPWVDKKYRTIPDRVYRAVGGLSRGGGWAVHLGLSRWDLFGAIGAHSLALFWEDSNHIRTWLDKIPPESLPRIFLDIGDRDRPQLLQSTRWFETLLTDKGVLHEWYLYPGYHEEAYWQSHLEQYLRWYAQNW